MAAVECPAVGGTKSTGSGRQVGLLVCFDIFYPEVSRVLAVKALASHIICSLPVPLGR